VVRWLGWLAAQMKAHDRSEFYLERMQPDWLPDERSKRRYSTLAPLAGGLVVGLSFGLFVGLVVGLSDGLVGALFAGLSFGLVIGSIGGLSFLVFGLDSLPAETLNWSWRWLAVVLVIGLPVVLSLWLAYGLAGLGGGLALGLVIGLPVVLVGGLRGGQMGERDLRVPNEGVRRSLRNGLTVIGTVVLVGGLVGALFGGLTGGLTSSLVGGLFFGLFFGLFVGLLFGLASGLGGAILHWTLLRQLRLVSSVPRRYVRFLDFCADHILLQRIGGGYRFIHALLLDYFATLYAEGAQDVPD
jgi:hypothetical protein